MVIDKCPFCGGDATLYCQNGRRGRFVYVKCDFCLSQGKTYGITNGNYIHDFEELSQDLSDSSTKAISAWNRRYGD